MAKKKYAVVDDGFTKYIEDTTLTEDKHEGHLYDAYEVCREMNKLVEENEQLKKENEDLYENDKILRQRMAEMSLNYQGVAVKRELFRDVLEILKEIDALDLYYDLYATTIDMGVNGVRK